MAYKTLQNPDLYGMGNDYKQDMKYVVEKDENGKTTWRDGIYTKLAYDIKDPEGYNKRSVNVPQDKWGENTFKRAETLSGETDGSALFTSGYATADSFGSPLGTTPETYYTSTDEVKVPQGIDVAPFRDVLSQDELKKA